jgi:hypothetical protein
MGSRTVHFDALRREVQLAARFNSERLVQARNKHCVPACFRTHAVITWFEACAATLAVRALFLHDAVNRNGFHGRPQMWCFLCNRAIQAR